MNEQTKMMIVDDGLERIITITPVILSFPGGLKLETGKYTLREDNVGLGTIKFDDDMQWEFDGFGDLDTDHLETVADYIKDHYAPLIDESTSPAKEPDQPMLNAAQVNKSSWFNLGGLFS